MRRDQGSAIGLFKKDHTLNSLNSNLLVWGIVAVPIPNILKYIWDTKRKGGQCWQKMRKEAKPGLKTKYEIRRN